MAKLAKILKTEMSGDLRALAEMLQSKGRGKDSLLAHITPAEAKRLKKAGGRGSRNPDTGLLEFDEASAPVAPDVTTPTIDVTSTAPAAAPAPEISAPDTFAGSSSGGATAPGDAYSAPYSSISLPTISATGQQTGSENFPYAPTGLSGDPLNLQAMAQSVGDQGAEQTADETQTLKNVYRDLNSRSSGLLSKLSGNDLARLGLAGVGGIAGLIQSRNAEKQIAAAQQQQQALAQPYQEQGRALTQAAAGGQLSPASAQAYQAARAQMQQQAAQRGGVGVEQMATQLEGFRQQLLQQQYTYGLQIAQIGDQISLGAIQTGLQLDQQLQQASQGFYTSLAAIAAGVPLKTGT